MYSRGARILDGAFMTQDLSFKATNSEAAMTVSSVSIADPYVLLMMTDGSIQLLVGGTSDYFSCFLLLFLVHCL